MESQLEDGLLSDNSDSYGSFSEGGDTLDLSKFCNRILRLRFILDVPESAIQEYEPSPTAKRRKVMEIGTHNEINQQMFVFDENAPTYILHNQILAI